MQATGPDSAVVWDDGSATDTAELLLTMRDCALSVVSLSGDGKLTLVAAGTLHLLQTAPSSLLDANGEPAEGAAAATTAAAAADKGGATVATNDATDNVAAQWLALLHVGGVIVPLPAVAPVARLDDGASALSTPTPGAGAGGGGDTPGGEPLLYMLALPDVSFVVHVPAATPADLVAEWEAALAQYGRADRLPPGGVTTPTAAAPTTAAPATSDRGVAGAADATASGAGTTAAAAADADGSTDGRPPPASLAAAAVFRASGALTATSGRVEAAVRQHGGRADAYWSARLTGVAARTAPAKPVGDRWTMSERQRKCLHRTRAVTGVGVRLTGGVANRLVGLLAAGVDSRGGRAAGRVVGGPDGGHRDALRGLIEAGVVSYGSVYTALDETGRALLASTVECGSEVVAARHGEDAAEATRAVGGIARDAVLMARAVNKAGVKGLTRLVAKRQGKHMLHRVSLGMAGKER